MLAQIYISTIVLASLRVIAAKQCAQFDTSNNLYLFGGEQDYNLGQSDSWACEQKDINFKIPTVD
jgi:hypothetical protein